MNITDKRIEGYIESLEVQLPAYLGELEGYAAENHVPIIKKPARSLLRFFIHLKRPKKILEVGAAIGFSSLLMSEYMEPDGSIVTIEKVPKRIEEARANIQRAGKNHMITLLEGDANEVLSRLAGNREAFDMIFMDAAKGQYLNFMDNILSMLPKGGVLISDNVLQDGDIAESRYAVTRRDRTIHFRMREYLYALTHNESLDTMILPAGDGITVSTRL